MNTIENHIFQCPHCHDYVIVANNEINCGIFRHGIFIHSHEQIPPHASQKECEQLFEQKLIYGCGKPFQICEGNSVKICDYI